MSNASSALPYGTGIWYQFSQLIEKIIKHEKTLFEFWRNAVSKTLPKKKVQKKGWSCTQKFAKKEVEVSRTAVLHFKDILADRSAQSRILAKPRKLLRKEAWVHSHSRPLLNHWPQVAVSDETLVTVSPGTSAWSVHSSKFVHADLHLQFSFFSAVTRK